MEEFRRTYSVSYQTGDRAVLRLSSANGNVTLRPHDAAEVRISVVADLWAETPQEADFDLETIKRGLTCEEDRVTINAPSLEPRRAGLFSFGRGPRIDYDIRVPRQTSLDSEGRNGRIDIRGISGPLTINHRNGTITVEDCNQSLDIDSRNGKVDVARLGHNLKVIGHNGKIQVNRVAGDTLVETRNGMIEVADVGGSVILRTDNGLVQYSGSVQANFDIEARNGMIRLRVPRDSRFEIDAESARGSVSSSLPVNPAAASAGPRPRVRLRTRMGNIRIDPL